jgi:hypothetical protein
MKIIHSKWQIDKVIKMYQNNSFTEFTLENLRPIRTITGLGYSDIKHIILEYNTNTSAGYPKPIEINTKEFANTKEFTQAFNDYLIYGKCILHVLDNDIVRYSSEKKRVKDKEP